MRSTLRYTAGFLTLCFCLQSNVQAAEPWDAPFTADTKAVQQAARAVLVADDQDIVILLQDHRFSIDATGRVTSIERLVFRILKQDAVEDWGSVEREYAPWYQRRPEIRARVISESGDARWLDVNTIADSPSREIDPNIFSDQRVLRAPLPAVSRGAVVEWEIIVRESAPLLDAGVTHRVHIADFDGLQRFRFSIEAAPNIRVETASGLIPESAIRRQTTAQGTRIESELGPLPPRKDIELNAPSDIPDRPYFAFSTGRSWQDVAARYESIVEGQIASPALGNLLQGVDLTGRPRDIAARLSSRLHKEVRYTGVEFADAAIVPRKPAEILQRQYGDCKD
jgi:hypothetical protein